VNIVCQFRNMSVSNKFKTLFFPIILISLIYIFTFFLTVSQTMKSISFMKERAFLGATYAKEIELSIIHIQHWLVNISATRGKDGLDEGFKKAVEAAKCVTEYLSKYEELAKNEPDTLKQLVEIKKKFAPYYSMGTSMAQIYVDLGPDVGNIYMAEFNKNAADLTIALNKLGSESQELYNKTVNDLEEYSRNRITLVTAFSIIIIGFVLFAYFVLNRTIIKQIKKTSHVLKDILEGQRDFTQRIEVDRIDELGEMAKHVNNFFSYMQGILTEVKESSVKVKNFSSDLSSIASGSVVGISHINTAMGEVVKGTTSQSKNIQDATISLDELTIMIAKIASGAEEQNLNSEKTMSVAKQSNEAMIEISTFATNQAASVEKVMVIVSEMTRALGQAANDTSKAAANSKQTRDIALNGEQILAETVDGMDRIKEKVLIAADKITELGKNSMKIGEIIDVIDDIAGQTNLLALNAAIEAARAGEHGRGFAVVADEVRKLAEKSSKATKEIAILIKSIQEATDIAVNFMNEGTSEVHSGALLVNQTRQAMVSIINAVRDTVSQIESISAATEQMAASSNEVAQNVKNLSEMAGSSTASVEEVAASSEGVVQSILTVYKIAKDSASISEEMVKKMGNFSGQILSILSVAEDNSSIAEETTASTEEITSSVNMIKESANDVADLAVKLHDSISQFKM